eukprot:2521421-Prymnesium_polylepis.1
MVALKVVTVAMVEKLCVDHSRRSRLRVSSCRCRSGRLHEVAVAEIRPGPPSSQKRANRYALLCCAVASGNQ